MMSLVFCQVLLFRRFLQRSFLHFLLFRYWFLLYYPQRNIYTIDRSLVCFCYHFPDVLGHVLFVLLLCYPRRSCGSLDAAIYLTSQSMHHLLTTQVFIRSLDYVTRNAAVSSSSITKSHLVISWPAQKSVPSLGFLRCVSLGRVAPSSLLKLNKSSYKV